MPQGAGWIVEYWSGLKANHSSEPHSEHAPSMTFPHIQNFKDCQRPRLIVRGKLTKAPDIGHGETHDRLSESLVVSTS